MGDLEQRLRDELPGLVPDPPAAPDRASRARGLARRARRRTAVVVAGATATIVAAVLLSPGLIDPTDEPTDPAGTTPDVTCPERVSTRGDGPLATDPVTVRLCSWGDFSYAPPSDALAGDAAQLARAVADLPDLSADSPCTAELGLSYALVFGYADGSRRVVTVEDFGCGEVRVLGGDAHAGGSALLPLFGDLLREQRMLQPPPDAPMVELTCVSGSPLAQSPPTIATVEDVTRAVVCVRDPGREAPLRTELTTDELNEVRRLDPGHRGGQPVSIRSCPTFERAWLVGETAWGEHYEGPLCADAREPDASTALIDALIARAVPEQ